MEVAATFAFGARTIAEPPIDSAEPVTPIVEVNDPVPDPLRLAAVDLDIC